MSEQIPKFLEEYQKAVIDVRCGWDGAELGPLEMYPHEGGHPVIGTNGYQWLYAKCTKCGYDWAYWKLLRRAEEPTEELKVPMSNLQFTKVTPIDKKRPWAGVCAKACWFARKRRCKCRCKRANHQRGFQKTIDDYNQKLLENTKFVGFEQAVRESLERNREILDALAQHDRTAPLNSTTPIDTPKDNGNQDNLESERQADSTVGLGETGVSGSVSESSERESEW